MMGQGETVWIQGLSWEDGVEAGFDRSGAGAASPPASHP